MGHLLSLTACDEGFDPIEDRLRANIRGTIYADVRSVVETARRRSIRAIDAIRLTLDERPLPVGT